MAEYVEITMNLVFTAFAFYGIVVLRRWKKAADKVNKMMDDLAEGVGNDG